MIKGQSFDFTIPRVISPTYAMMLSLNESVQTSNNNFGEDFLEIKQINHLPSATLMRYLPLELTSNPVTLPECPFIEVTNRGCVKVSA